MAGKEVIVSVSRCLYGDVPYGLRLSLCSSCLVMFPMAGDCLCVLAARCLVMFPVAGDCLCVLASRCLVMFPVAGDCLSVLGT